MKIMTKTVTEFGQAVTLTRITTADGKKGTLWHRDADKALVAWERLAPLRGWQ